MCLFVGAWAQTRTLFCICSAGKISLLQPLVCIHMSLVCSYTGVYSYVYLCVITGGVQDPILTRSGCHHLIKGSQIPITTRASPLQPLVCIHKCMSYLFVSYGVAKVSRIDKIISFFCKRALYKRPYSEKPIILSILPISQSILRRTKSHRDWREHTLPIFTPTIFLAPIFSLGFSLSLSLSLAIPIQICNGSLGLAAHTIPIVTHILSLSLCFPLSHTFSLSLAVTIKMCKDSQKMAGTLGTEMETNKLHIYTHIITHALSNPPSPLSSSPSLWEEDQQTTRKKHTRAHILSPPPLSLSLSPLHSKSRHATPHQDWWEHIDTKPRWRRTIHVYTHNHTQTPSLSLSPFQSKSRHETAHQDWREHTIPTWRRAVSLRPVPLQNKFASNCWVRGFPPPTPFSWFCGSITFFLFLFATVKQTRVELLGSWLFPPPPLVSGLVSLSLCLFLSLLLPLPNRFGSNCLVHESTFLFFGVFLSIEFTELLKEKEAPLLSTFDWVS